jgi:hypothetical protein
MRLKQARRHYLKHQHQDGTLYAFRNGDKEKIVYFESILAMYQIKTPLNTNAHPTTQHVR